MHSSSPGSEPTALPACLFSEGCLKNRRGKKKKRFPTELIGFNFLCLKMSWLVFMLVVSSDGVAASQTAAAVTGLLGEKERRSEGVCLELVQALLPTAEFSCATTL